MTSTVTVVVPSYNRLALLQRLVSQGFGGQVGVGFEVVVVDDCSGDGSWEWLETAVTSAPFPMRRERTPRNSGPATARNVGWRVADTEWVAFVDDDCVPEPGWLQALIRAASDADVVQGATLPFPEQAAGRGPFARFNWVDRDYGRYETCNIAYRRSLLEKLGGFDESFGTVEGTPEWGEDTDLGWRAREAGAVIRFEPGAMVRCEVYRSDYLVYLRQLRRRGGLVRNVARHPGIRDHYPMGMFMQESHPFAVLALIGALGALAGRRSGASWVVGAALAAPYAWYRGIANPLPCRRRNFLPVLALGWVADLADTGVLAAASVRYRTFFI